MSAREVMRFALSGLSANKVRSALTTLGVLIGVGSVILLIAVGNGSSRQIEANIEALGTNTLTVFSGGAGRGASQTGTVSSSQVLTLAAATALGSSLEAPDVASVSPEVGTSETITYEGSSTTSSVVGTYPSYFTATNSPVGTGSAFTSADLASAAKTIVLGQTVVSDLFGTASPIGAVVQVGSTQFTVVGVLANKGGSGFNDPNDVAVAPLTTVQQNLTGFGALSSIVVQATSPSTVADAQAEITSILDQQLGITSASQATYRILNQSQLLTTRTATSKTFTVLLGAVAGISLLVGGIGITNIMLVTVTERTREIGIRKALGAPRGAILAQFLAEATLLSLVGGLLGVGLALAGSRLTIVGVHPAVVPASIPLALGVAMAIGIFFGGYPANRAASLRPVEALRYE
ncbi:MAG: ABC transporter permease [Actinomycetes bacterium]